jgi:alpha-amylase/alpha-mannosidase (GH57 family)
VTTAFRSVVIHGHFYQPPRDDPWLEEIEREPSAAPYHDWNERIEQECYRAVVAARLHAPDGRIARILNTLESMSFDYGPTLLEWLEREAPATYAGVLAADRASVAGRGYGNAIAMPYHHVILPLAPRREKVTEVRWGIADFRRRFAREPVGMWLPETAVDDETLDVLAAEGIRFTVLAPHQVRHAPPTGLPGRYRTHAGREIAVFVYDGEISHDVAFGPLLRDSRLWLGRLGSAERERGGDARVVTIATDGETFGHHHRFGEMALAWFLAQLERRADLRVDNFAALLAQHPPAHDVALVAPSSWSCPHGVERWRADCGCRIAADRPTQQRWRAPLRAGLDWLAGELHAVFERDGGALFPDPWEAREAYGAVVSGDAASVARFVASRVRPEIGPSENVRARELLELERNALRMFTSCGWFFDDLAGIEPLQVLRYAARAIELAGAGEAARLESGLLYRLAAAESNDPAAGNGRTIYLERVKPRIAPILRIAAGGVAAARLAPGDPSAASPYYAVHEASGRVQLTHCRTGREYDLRVAFSRTSGGRIAVDVGPPGGPPAATLGLADLPERQQRAVTVALRRELTERRITPALRTAVLTGAADLPRAAGQALVEALSRLERDQSAAALEAVSDLADLLELWGLTIPFDAQTEFYRLQNSVTRDVAARFAPVARRLGFADTELGDR